MLEGLKEERSIKIFIIKTLLIFLISIKLTSFLSVIILIKKYKLKKLQTVLTKESLDYYFNEMGIKGFLKQLYGYFLGVLVILATLNTFLFWNGIYAYGVALILCGILYIRYKAEKAEYRYYQKYHQAE